MAASRPPLSLRSVSVHRCAVLLAALLGAAANARPADDLPVDAARLAVVKDRTRSLSPDEQSVATEILASVARRPSDELQRDAQQFLNRQRHALADAGDKTDVEFLVEDLLRRPDVYRGRVVQISGYVEFVERKPVGNQELYAVQIFTDEGQSSPVEVYCAALPSDWPDAPVIDDVIARGVFVKLLEYTDEVTGRPAVEPLLLAHSIVWRPRLPPGNPQLDSALWSVVRNKSLGVLKSERDLYYRLLNHARSLDPQTEKRAADRDLRERIEAFRTAAETERRETLDKIDARVEEHADPTGNAVRAREAAESRYRRKLQLYTEFRDKPATFPVYLDIYGNYQDYAGRLVTLRGRLRELTPTPVDDNVRYDLNTLYEAWIYTDDSQSHPAVLVCTQVPEELLEVTQAEGDNLDEKVSMTGYFFKMYAYEAQDADRFAPMLLGRTLQWQPAKSDDKPVAPPWAYALAAALALIVVVAVIKQMGRSEAELRQSRPGHEQSPPPADLNRLTVSPPPKRPAFDGIEASGEPDFRHYGND